MALLLQPRENPPGQVPTSECVNVVVVVNDSTALQCRVHHNN